MGIAASSASAQPAPAGAPRELPPTHSFEWLDMLTGWERSTIATAQLTYLLPGWTQDALGSWTRVRGSGRPRRVVACALDRPAYVVSEITDDGYLRVHDPVAGRRQHPLWDQFHVGQRVRVPVDRPRALANDFPGPAVPGVIGVRSTHLYRRRGVDSTLASADEMYVDVGARSRAEALALGVRLLAPVTREWSVVGFRSDEDAAGAATGMSWWAAPAAGQRAGCDAVAAAADATPAAGQTIFVVAAQSAYDYTGLAAVLARLGPVDSLTIVDPAAVAGRVADSVAVTRSTLRAPLRVPGGAPRQGVALAVRSRFPGTLVESVHDRDALALRAAVARAAGVDSAAVANVATRPLDAAARTDRRTRALPTTAQLRAQLDATPGTLRGIGHYGSEEGVPDAAHPDSLADAARLLAHLANTYGVSGHEERVRDAVREQLPAWARSRATVDSAGNLVVAVGPGRDTVAFVAHLDEIGYEVTAIRADGQVALRPLGGAYLSLWEGQPAILHFDDFRPRPLPDGAEPGEAYYTVSDTRSDLRGVFVPRASASTRQPAGLTAWFGLDSAALVGAGVRVGQTVTGVKWATRLGPVRFTARSSDDRTGCAALILAMRALDPARFTHAVVFAFTTREEVGLNGAAALAAELGPNVRRVYAVDTFVAGDAPLESHRFAYTPLGAGAVVRAVDNSSAAPLPVVDDVLAAARAARVPVQVGTTNGGNDGAELARGGAVDVPLSWPGRYSHSPVEVLDLRDLRALARLIAALAQR